MLASSSYSRLSRAAERSQVSTVAAGHCKAEAVAKKAHDTSAGSMKRWRLSATNSQKCKNIDEPK
jgi:hypothetical protein